MSGLFNRPGTQDSKGGSVNSNGERKAKNVANIETARQVVKAINEQDKDAFYGAFIAPTDVRLSDDGNPQDFETWATREVFSSKNTLTINKEAEDSTVVRFEGEYDTAAYGAFNTFWNFTFNDQGKIVQIDVGAL